MRLHPADSGMSLHPLVMMGGGGGGQLCCGHFENADTPLHQQVHMHDYVGQSLDEVGIPSQVWGMEKIEGKCHTDMDAV